ncbi:MAG: hypothetical protein ABSG03_06190 [Bryobacteraceae bacterium]|jgi:hypothetical protein
MRYLLIGFAAISAIALAQTPPPATIPPATPAPTQATTAPATAAPQDAKPPVAQTPAAATPATATPAAATPAATPDAAATSPVPSSEAVFTGWIDFGYTWRSNVAGSMDAYRSFVNLGSGPKLIGTEFTLTDPKHRLFDQIHVRAYDWGDDPYSTLHVDARKAKLYDLRVDYRDIAYFDALPSYADPLLGSGIALNEQSFDMRRRMGSAELTLLPGHWISPYFAFDRDTGSGTGVSTYVSNADEFPVPAIFHDRTNNYRGGVRLEFRRFHVTLEQGGTTFENDQTLYQSGGVNYGNSLTPIFGQTLDLTDLLGAYGARGTSIYTRALVTASPMSWLDVYGQFLYSEPKTTVNYEQYAGGNLYLQSEILFYSAQQYLVSSAAAMPHTTGNLGAEIRPWRRVRIVESWTTDRLHNSGSSPESQTLTGGATVEQQTAALLESSLVTNYNQAEALVYFDATSKLTLRGGYRYVWGDANDAVLPAEGLASMDNVKLRQNVGIGGFTYRPIQKFSFSAEGESASSGSAYFRTSLYDYQKVRAEARYHTGALSFSADFNLLNNQDPLPGIDYDYLSHQESLSIMWSPAGGKVFDFEGSYTRSDLYSNINYLSPATEQSLPSNYRDNSHIASTQFHINPPHKGALAPVIIAGGSLVISSGSRPTTYYQPMAKFSLPAGKHLTWFAEWRYYGYNEAFYLYEAFRAHIVTVGLRLTR